jgi:small subunit ribosomal protein S16
VAVKIRLKRLGKVRVPQYRIVIVDSRKKRDGKVIEEIGKYHPKEDPSYIDVVSDRAQYWLGVGAQPTEAVEAILKVTGDWQTFKGLPGAEGTLRVAAPKRDKLEIFNEALKEASSEPKGGAVTKKASKKTEKPEKTEKAEKTEKPEKAEEKVEAKAETQSPESPEAAPADKPAEVPASETPEGAAAEAEIAETANVDAERADDKAGKAGA